MQHSSQHIDDATIRDRIIHARDAREHFARRDDDATIIDKRDVTLTTQRERTRYERERMTCIVESMLMRLTSTHTINDDDVDATIQSCVEIVFSIVTQQHAK